MIRFIPAIALFLFVRCCFGQGSFARSYEVPTDLMETTSVGMRVVEAANSDLLLCSNHAQHDPEGNTYYIGLVQRMTADGTTLWRKKIGSVNVDLRITGIRELPDGTISVVGVMGSGNASAALLHFTASGDPLLSKRYAAVGGMGFDDVAASSDSTLLIVGYRLGPSSGPLIMIASNDGTVVDAGILSYADLGGGFHRITRCTDGGWLLVGDGAGSMAAGIMPYNLLIAKLDSAGSLTWATRLERPITWGTGYMYMGGGNEIPGDGFRIIADQSFTVPFGHGFLLAALTDQGQLTWSKKLTPSFSFPARTSLNLNDTTLAVTGGYLQGNVISFIGASGTHHGTYVNHPGSYTRDAIGTSDGMIVSTGLASSAFDPEADAPALVKDEMVPTMCTVAGVAMAQDTFGLAPYQDHVPVPLDLATWDFSADLTITDQVVVETSFCFSVAIASEDPPAVSTWLAGDRLIVSGQKVDRVSVLDVSGRVVREAFLHGRDRGEVDLSGTAPGIYAVLVHQGRSIHASKVLKE